MCASLQRVHWTEQRLLLHCSMAAHIHARMYQGVEACWASAAQASEHLNQGRLHHLAACSWGQQ